MTSRGLLPPQPATLLAPQVTADRLQERLDSVWSHGLRSASFASAYSFASREMVTCSATFRTTGPRCTARCGAQDRRAPKGAQGDGEVGVHCDDTVDAALAEAHDHRDETRSGTCPSGRSGRRPLR
jgi:hypothetical protein